MKQKTVLAGPAVVTTQAASHAISAREASRKAADAIDAYLRMGTVKTAAPALR